MVSNYIASAWNIPIQFEQFSTGENSQPSHLSFTDQSLLSSFPIKAYFLSRHWSLKNHPSLLFFNSAPNWVYFSVLLSSVSEKCLQGSEWSHLIICGPDIFLWSFPTISPGCYLCIVHIIYSVFNKYLLSLCQELEIWSGQDTYRPYPYRMYTL